MGTIPQSASHISLATVARSVFSLHACTSADIRSFTFICTSSGVLKARLHMHESAVDTRHVVFSGRSPRHALHNRCVDAIYDAIEGPVGGQPVGLAVADCRA